MKHKAFLAATLLLLSLLFANLQGTAKAFQPSDELKAETQSREELARESTLVSVPSRDMARPSLPILDFEVEENTAQAETSKSDPSSEVSDAKEEATIETEDIQKESDLIPKWSDRISIRGYMQLRYNGLFESNPDLKCAQCDRSWGDGGGFFFRRIRLVFFGELHEKVYFYFQPDFASGGSNLSQVRDAYFDIALDNKKEFRFRLGQSKVPFGFENLQSSQNRIALDRNDALNSAVANERDIGIFGYWAPAEKRALFRYLVNSGLKGSGDYGVVGFGVYNGQTANMPQRNSSQHVVGRFTYPFQLASGQIMEASLQGYSGTFGIQKSLEGDDFQTDFDEHRMAATFVLYPQPFGLQAEYNVGRGPEFNPSTMRVEDRELQGGYIMASYFIENKKGLFIPFVRWHYYEGGKKHEIDATRHRVNEQEIGIEWQPNPFFELVAMYTFSDRTFENALNPNNRQMGSLLRLQAQVNF